MAIAQKFDLIMQKQNVVLGCQHVKIVLNQLKNLDTKFGADQCNHFICRFHFQTIIKLLVFMKNMYKYA